MWLITNKMGRVLSILLLQLAFHVVGFFLILNKYYIKNNYVGEHLLKKIGSGHKLK